MQAGAPLELSTPGVRDHERRRVPRGPRSAEARDDARAPAHDAVGLLLRRRRTRTRRATKTTCSTRTRSRDYYRYTLRVPMDRPPGEKGVYCSIDPNLALGVVSRATGESPMDTFDRLLGAPIADRALTPGRSPGGTTLRRRRRAVPAARLPEARPAHAQRRHLEGAAGSSASDFVAARLRAAARPQAHPVRLPVVEHRVSLQGPHCPRLLCRRQRRAGRDGGPGARPVIATYGGSYATRVGLHIQQNLAPNYILPAVREPGDDRNAPVIQRNFSTPYGRSPAPAN